MTIRIDSGRGLGCSRRMKTSFVVGLALTAVAFVACGEGSSSSSSSSGSGAAGGTNTTNVGGGGGTGGSGDGGSLFGGSNPGELDDDGDGIPNEVEGQNAPGGATDTDMDGTPDYLDSDSDDDGLSDAVEGTDDGDNDGIPNFQDPFNDGPPGAITLTAITTPFVEPIGIDYHEPTHTVIVTANYPSGLPYNFERIEADGTHQQFSTVSGFTDEVKIGTVRSGNPAGFVEGDLFVGNGVDGQIVRVTDNGNTVQNPWVDLPGAGNGLMRGSLYVDRTGLYGHQLVVCTTLGEVWQIDANGSPTLLGSAPGVHLEGLMIVPNAPVRYGPLAGKIIAGAEAVGLLYAFDQNGNVDTYDVGVLIEDIDIVLPNENFFGINYGTGNLLGSGPDSWTTMIGDIVLTQETHTSTGLYRLQWDGQALAAVEIPVAPNGPAVGQWEHVTFAPAGIQEIPEIPPPQ
jgi:hypothetical protein